MTDSITFSIGVNHFLLSQGYSSSNLLFHRERDAHFRPDITIIDTNTDRVLALIVTKEKLTKTDMHDFGEACALYLDRAGESVPIYLFSGNDTDPCTPKMYCLDGDGNWKPISEIQFPNYETLASQERSKMKSERKEAVDEFKNGAYLVSFVLLILVGLSLWSGQSFTNQELYLLAGAFLAMALPHYAKIKIANLELERRQVESRVVSGREK